MLLISAIMDLYSLIYNPTEADNYSKVASFAIPQIFNQVTERHAIYNSFALIPSFSLFKYK